MESGNKTKELIVYRTGPKSKSPPPSPGIARVSMLNVLGVILDETCHSGTIIEQRVSAACSMYVLKVVLS